MKTIITFYFCLLFSQLTHAETFYSFLEKTYYEIDGKFIQNEKFSYFSINFNNANEEKIQFKNNEMLTPSKRYRLCIYNYKNCHLDCKAEIKKVLNSYSPWEEVQAMVPDSTGHYLQYSRKDCR